MLLIIIIIIIIALLHTDLSRHIHRDTKLYYTVTRC